jgi:hypothetical protein
MDAIGKHVMQQTLSRNVHRIQQDHKHDSAVDQTIHHGLAMRNTTLAEGMAVSVKEAELNACEKD